MDYDHVGVTTTFTLDSHPFGHYAEAVDRFLPDCLRALASRAGSLIRQCHVVDPAFDADDAVQDALLEFWRATRGGKLGPLESAERFVKLLAHKLKQGVLDEREREEARKRGGASLRRVDADLEAIDSHAVPSEELALAEERVEVWLPRLHRRDPVLRAIAVKKADGFNRREIAAQLGLPERAVEYGTTLIKAILRSAESD